MLLSKVEVDRSKTNQVSATSSKDGSAQLQNEEILQGHLQNKHGAILRAFFQKWQLNAKLKLNAELTPSCQYVLRFFHPTSLTYCACHDKVSPGHTKCSTCHAKYRKMILANLKIWCSKAQPFSGNQRPDLRTCLMEMSLVLHLSGDVHLSSLCQTPHAGHRLLKARQNPYVWLLLWRCRTHCACHAKRRFNVQICCGFTFLASKRPSRSSRVHFLDGSLSKMPPMFFFFHFETRFAPQPRTLFQQFNVQNRSGPEALLAFWLENLLRATAAWLFRNTISKIARSMTRFNYFDFETRFFTTVAGTYWFLFWPDGAAAALARAHFSILRSRKTLQTSFSHTLIVFLLASSFLPLPSAAAASVHKLQVWLPNFFL